MILPRKTDNVFFQTMLNLSGGLQSTNHCVRKLKLVNNSPTPWGRVATEHKDHVVTMTTSETILTLSSPLCIAGSCSPAAAWIHCWTASGRRSLIIRMYSSARALFFCLQEYTRKNQSDSLIFRDLVFGVV